MYLNLIDGVNNIHLVDIIYMRDWVITVPEDSQTLPAISWHTLDDMLGPGQVFWLLVISYTSFMFVDQAISNLFDISQYIESENVSMCHYPGRLMCPTGI